MAGRQGTEVCSAARGIALGSILVAALCVALASLPAASADAASGSPFKTHGVLASCGKGEKRSTVYMTFLSLRNRRGFEDVKALLRHAEEVRPRETRIRLAGRSGKRNLRPIGASLPDFLFIDYLEAKGGPGAATHERSTISWRSKRTDRRVRSSLRLRDLGKGFCRPGKEKASGKARMLREAVLGAESGAGETPGEPEANRGPGGGAAERQAAGQCPTGTYYGRADDGTEVSFAFDAAAGYVTRIQASARDGELRYEVGFLETPIFERVGSRFHTHSSVGNTGFGYSPPADMSGHCGSQDRFQVTIRDRAGHRTATLSRAVLEPGLYKGSAWAQEHPRDRSNMRMQFLIYHPSQVGYPGCYLGDYKCRLSQPKFSGSLPWKPRVWTGATWFAADNCQLGFTAYRGDHGSDTSVARLETATSCEPGNRVAGEMLLDSADLSTVSGRWSSMIWSMSFEARLVDTG